MTVDSMIIGLRSIFDAAAAGSLAATFELHVGDAVIHACVAGGHAEVGAGPLPNADLVIEAGLAIKDLMSGDQTPAEAVRAGLLRCTGRLDLLDRFVEAFRIRSAPAASVR